MLRFALLAPLFLLLLASGESSSRSNAAVASSLPEPSLVPVIEEVDPGPVEPWSYLALSGQNLMNADGSCSVQVGGTPSYVVDCSPTAVRAIVPWSAHTGSVVITANGLASDAAPISIAPLQLDTNEIIGGAIQVKTGSGADLPAVLAEEGDLATAAEALGDAADPYLSDWYEVTVPRGSEVAKAISYSRHSEVLYAAPIPAPAPADAPNDSLYSSQWALAEIDAAGAWGTSVGDGVKIAVIDTGFATGHPDLAAHMTTGWNCDGSRDVTPFSQFGERALKHGTEVAGVAAAATNNYPEGIAGAGWNSLILPLRYDALAHDDFAGESCSWPEAYEGFLIDKAVAEGAKVVNMSYTYGTYPMPAVCSKMEEAWGAGSVLVAGAGNDNSANPQDPAACDRVVSTAATNRDDSQAWYTNFGSWIDVSAPGGTCADDPTQSIVTTDFPSGYTNSFCGTSAAAPHVAGLAALLMARGLDNCEVVETIVRTADPINWAGGSGRINAGRAVTNPQDCPLEDAANSADLNADGRNDLLHLCCADYGNAWISQGSAFGVAAFQPGWGPWNGSWQTGDFNGDGRTDQVHIDVASLQVLFSQGDGSFAIASWFSPWTFYGMEAGVWRVGDFNGDGRSDLIHLCCSDYANVWLSDGDGTFTVPTSGFRPWQGYGVQQGSWRVGDINGDGRSDLLHICCANSAFIWLSDGDGTFTVNQGGFQPSPGYGMEQGKWRTGDYNGDGKTDLLHLCCANSANLWLSNGAAFAVSSFQPWSDYDMQRGLWRAGDFNGDARTDVIHIWDLHWANIWLSNGAGFAVSSFQPWPNYGMQVGKWQTGDFDGDGRSDLLHIWGSNSSDLWRSQGNGTFSVSGFQPWPAYGMQAGKWRAADYTGDRDRDYRLDGADNCPATHNPGQANMDGDSLGDACDTEDDGDGFTDAAEANVGTNPLDNCGNPTTTSPYYSQSWPPDLNSTGITANKVDIQDIASYIAPVRRINTSPGDAGYHVRWDVSPGSGGVGKIINIADMSFIVTVQPLMFGASTRAFNGPACTP